MAEQQPKPCPYCGGKSTISSFDDHLGDYDYDDLYICVEHTDWECYLAQLSGMLFQVIDIKYINEWNERKDPPQCEQPTQDSQEDYGQWPSYVVEKMKAQGRTPPTYNITAKKIESNIGNFLANGFDMKFEATSGRKSDWAFRLRDMALSDKRNCDWQTSENVCLRDMHVMVGYERMVISDQHDSVFGNIGYESLCPTHVYPSPSWKSPKAFDISNYFEWGFYLVEEMIRMYPRMADELKEWRDREELTGIDFGNYHGGVQRWANTDQKWGSYHRVITFHSVYGYDREWEYDLVNHCPFPENGFKPGSDGDHERKQRYVQENNLGDNWITIKQKKREKRIESIVPSLNSELFLCVGKDRIQTNNCNLYPLGNSLYGQFRGTVDDLYDTNVDFNSSQMSILDIQKRAAKGGRFLDEGIVQGDDQKMHEIEVATALPGANIWLPEGSTKEYPNGIIPIQTPPPSPDLFNISQQRLVLADWLTTPAAADARNDVANPSGKLFQSQVAVAQIGQKYPLAILERHKREKLQAYAIQAKITYSGYPRSFSSLDGEGEALEINQPGEDPMGRRVWINKIDIMPDMKVTLVPAQNGLDLKTELRQSYADIIQQLNDPNYQLLKSIMLEGIFETIDNTEEKRDEIKKACMMIKQFFALQLTINYKGLLSQAMQQGLIPPGAQPTATDATVVTDELDNAEAVRGTLQDEVTGKVSRQMNLPQQQEAV